MVNLSVGEKEKRKKEDHEIGLIPDFHEPRSSNG